MLRPNAPDHFFSSAREGRIIRLIRRAAESLAAGPALSLLLFSLIFLPPTLAIAFLRPFWLDEIFTAYVSRLGNWRLLWDALEHAIDLQPPPFYIFTHLIESSFGPSELSARLPALMGFWLAGASLIFFLGRRWNYIWGLIAALFLLLTGAFAYAYEARPYGLVVGFGASALLAWQRATEGGRRKLSLVGITASLILGAWSHYYGLLLFFPIVVGEAVRSYRGRKIDRAVWGAILSAAPAVFAFLPIIRKAVRIDAEHPWNPPKITILRRAFEFFFATPEVGMALIALLCIGVLCSFLSVPRLETYRLPISIHEAAAVFAFLALPIPALIVGFVAAHMLYARYLPEMAVGGSVLFAWGAHRIAGGRLLAGLAFVAALGCIFLSMPLWFTLKSMGHGKVISLGKGDPFPDLPVVVGSYNDFSPDWYYGTPAQRSRLVYVSDADAALKFGDPSTYVMDQILAAGEPFFHWHVESWNRFRQQHPRFLLYWMGEGWLLPAYRELGADFQLIDTNRQGYLFLVTVKR